jgi:anaerobic selenocysteine-containing dehydrogenase
MHVLAGEDLVDTTFIDRHVLGFPELKATVLPAFPPSRVEELTGVPAETIRQLARDYGRAQSPFIRIGRGLSRHEQGGMSVRAISCLPALVGAYAREGGGAFLGTGTGMAFAMERVTRPDLLARPTREINMVRLGRALTEAMEPPVQSLYVYHSNPAAVVPEQNLVLSGLSREDLFTVVHERFMTDTARYADIVLPATFSVEQHDLYGSYGHFYVQRTRPVVAPPATAKSNWQTFTLLARALGWSEEPFLRSEEEMVDELLAHETPFLEGIDREALSLGRAVRLNTGHLTTAPFQTASDIGSAHV